MVDCKAGLVMINSYWVISNTISISYFNIMLKVFKQLRKKKTWILIFFSFFNLLTKILFILNFESPNKKEREKKNKIKQNKRNQWRSENPLNTHGSKMCMRAYIFLFLWNEFPCLASNKNLEKNFQVQKPLS